MIVEEEENQKREENKKATSLLIERSKQGDLDAFSNLVHLYQKKAYGLALSYLKNHHDAEDISQEAFIQVFRKLSSFDMTGSFGAWLYTIVANLSKNKIRWRMVRERITFSMDRAVNSLEEDESVPVQVADSDRKANPFDHTSDSLDSQLIQESIDQLPEQQRVAIRLKFIQGYKILEVARLMNLAEGTVKTHIFRGLESLKKALEKKHEV